VEFLKVFPVIQPQPELLSRTRINLVDNDSLTQELNSITLIKNVLTNLQINKIKRTRNSVFSLYRDWSISFLV